LAPTIGSGFALTVSGLLLSIFILVVAWVSTPWFRSSESKTYVFVGVTWLVLTLAFEFLFGHLVAEKPWQELMQVFDIRKGDLFIVVLFATLAAPWIAAKLRGLT
jgi:hypothetical protein